MSAPPPGEVRPVSMLRLAGISLGTFLVVFLLLEAVEPRWVSVFRASATPTSISLAAQPTPRVPASSAVRRRSATPQTGGQSATAVGQPGSSSSTQPVGDLPEQNTAVVVETQGQGARLRSDPGSQARVIAVIEEGATVELIGQEADVEDRIWFKVRAEDDLEGWIAGDLLAPAEPVGGQ